MEQRTLGRTGRSISEIGLGTWQIGGDWGDVAEADAFAVLNAFRQKPLEQVLPAAQKAGVGIIARVPLTSGLLSGALHPGDGLRGERSPQLQPAG